VEAVVSEQGVVSASVDELRKLVADVLDRDETAIGYETEFVQELGVDSLMALEVLVTLESRYQVKLSEDELKHLTCLRSVHELLRSKGALAD
jgi:acyl carrier protein